MSTPHQNRNRWLPRGADLYEFYNPWSGFHRGSLAWCWDRLNAVLRTRWNTNPPASLGIYNAATGYPVVQWASGQLYRRDGLQKEWRPAKRP